MKRALGLIVSIWMCFAVSGQTLTNYQYWIDADRLLSTTSAMPANTGSAEVNWSIPTTDLREGMHALFYRFQDNAGAWSSPSAWQFFVVRTPENAIPAVSTIEYWVDTAVVSRTTLPVSDDAVAFSIDTRSMREGFHTLTYRLTDNEGFYSAPSAWQFFVVRTPENAIPAVSTIEYWVDTAVVSRKTSPVSDDAVAFSIDTRSMREGFHTLTYRLTDNEGFYSAPSAWQFFVVRTPENAIPAVSAIEYWVDTAVVSRKTSLVSDDAVAFSIDTRSMREGLHTLTYRLKDNEGFYSAARTWHFFVYRIPAHATAEVVAMEYWIDNNVANRQQQTLSSQEAVLSLDVMALGEGEHVLYYRLLDNEGVYSAVFIHPFQVLNPYNPVMLLPYDTPTLNTLQRAANPDYMAYPTAIESQLPEIECINPED